MDRKKFLKKGVIGLASIVALPKVITACKDNDDAVILEETGCAVSPTETVGPFPIKTPADYVRENIIGNRAGVALLITLTIQQRSNNCLPAEDVLVDIWHCDADGNYSEYGGNFLQQTDYTGEHFLRGRQTSDTNGQVSFISIFPGWYPNRAPHIHVEILDGNENSLLVTQIAFPKEVYDTVYASQGYNGEPDTTNEGDSIFADSLEENMLDTITGNMTDGYALEKTIIIA